MKVHEMTHQHIPVAEAMSAKLLASGYQHLSEKDPWEIEKGGKCEPTMICLLFYR
jgi:hypothetical protein